MRFNILLVLIVVVLNSVNYTYEINRPELANLNGFVYDKRNGEALIGANVYVKDKNVGSSTNISGFFSIAGLNSGNYTLIVSYIGYKSVSITAKVPQDKPLKIELESLAIETEEVLVSSNSEKTIEKLFAKPISKIELSQKEINSIPRVIEADLLRSLQTLPGITTLSDFSSALYIRGGTPDQNLYLIDGTDVYNPEHAFGIFSTFNTNSIKKVDISKGGFGANYGGRLSSVLNVTNLDGNRNYFEGTANISLLSASTTLQLPLGSIGSLSGSIRRTYIDKTYSKWVKEVPDYYFWDGNLKAFFDLGIGDKLTVSVFKSYDELNYKLDKDRESWKFDYNWGNVTTSLNYKHIFTEEVFNSFWLTGSWYESNFDFESVKVNEKNGITDIGIKNISEYYASNNYSIVMGIEYKYLTSFLRQSWEFGLIDVDVSRNYFSGFLNAEIKSIDKLIIEAGLRYSYFDSDVNYSNFEPRLSLKYRLSDESNIKFATGVYSQYVNRIPRLFFASIWTTADEHTSDSKSNHYVFGYQYSLLNLYEFEVETYYKSYKNLHVFNNNIAASVAPSRYDQNGFPIYTSSKGIFLTGDGESYGIEFLIRKNFGSITGWVAYSLSRTNYKFDDINQGQYHIPRHDRSSVVNGLLNVDIGSLLSSGSSRSTSKWLLGVNFIYASGQPITVPSSAYITNTLPDWDNIGSIGTGTPAYNLFPSEINSYRLPDYIRMDVSLTYEKNFGSWTLSPYLQIFNIGNRRNVWFITYENELKDGKIVQNVDKVNMLPVLPSIGINIKF